MARMDKDDSVIYSWYVSTLPYIYAIKCHEGSWKNRHRLSVFICEKDLPRNEATALGGWVELATKYICSGAKSV